MKKISQLIFIISLITIPSFALKQNEIESSMRTKINSVLVILHKKISTEQKGKEIIKIMDPVFDYEIMSQIAIGKAVWKKATLSQKKLFAKAFEAKLKQSYIDKLDLYDNQKVVIKGVKPYKKVRLKLNTELIGKGEIHKINYNFYNKANDWLIYDVEIDGVSIIQTYRNQFAGLLKEKSLDQLIAQLKSQ